MEGGWLPHLHPHPHRSVDKAVEKIRTTATLSTEDGDAAKLLPASPALCRACRTDFEGTQVPVTTGKTWLVHKKQAALLLLLFIYRTFKEQPAPRNAWDPCRNPTGHNWSSTALQAGMDRPARIPTGAVAAAGVCRAQQATRGGAELGGGPPLHSWNSAKTTPPRPQGPYPAGLWSCLNAIKLPNQ